MDEHILCKAAFILASNVGWDGMRAGLTQQLRQDHDIRLPSRGGSYDLGKIANLVKLFEINTFSRDQHILKGTTAEPGNHLQAAYYSFRTEFRFEPYISGKE